MTFRLVLAFFSVVPADPMVPEVWVAPPDYLLVYLGVGIRGALDCLNFIQGLDVPMYFLYEFLHCSNGCVLRHIVVGLLGQLRCVVNVGASKVRHCRPVFSRCLIKIS